MNFCWKGIKKYNGQVQEPAQLLLFEDNITWPRAKHVPLAYLKSGMVSIKDDELRPSVHLVLFTGTGDPIVTFIDQTGLPESFLLEPIGAYSF